MLAVGGGGGDVGTELKQGEMEELILLYRSRPAGEGLEGPGQCPPSCPWSPPGQPLHSDQLTGLGLTKVPSWGEAQLLPQGSRKGEGRRHRGPWGVSLTPTADRARVKVVLQSTRRREARQSEDEVAVENPLSL